MIAHAFARRLAVSSCFALMTAFAGQAVRAEVAVDPIGDFLPTYVGVRGGDLDVKTAEFAYDGANFVVKATENGNVGATPGGFFVFGFQRGAGTPRLAAVASAVLFDSVLTVTPGQPTTVRDLITGVATTLPASATVISGGNITVTLPAGLLPTQGLKPTQFQINLWPRSGGTNDLIADFAPNNSDVLVTLGFPAPAAASAQTEIAIDNGGFLFDSVAARLADRRDVSGAERGSVFLTASGRHANGGLSGSTISKSDTGAVTGGFDYAIGPRAVIGVGASGGSTRAKLGAAGSLRVKNATGMVYGAFGGATGLYLDALAAYSKLNIESHRTIPIGAGAFTGEGSPDGTAYTLAARAGYGMAMGDFTWGPVIDLVSTRAKIDPYSESGAADFGATVAGRTRTSTRLGLGLELAQNREVSWGSVSTHLAGRVVQELGDRNDDFSFDFTAQPGTSFAGGGAPITRTYGVVDIGVDAKVGPKTLIGLAYSPRFDKDGFVDNALNASARFLF